MTVGEIMQDAGYVTAAIGKWGLGDPDSAGAPWRKGFDHIRRRVECTGCRKRLNTIETYDMADPEIVKALTNNDFEWIDSNAGVPYA